MNIEWTDRALKDLEDLESHIAKRIIDKVEDATDLPESSTFRSSLEASSRDFPEHYLSPLKGYDLYKIRIGDYRAIVSVDEEKLIVVTTDHRKNIYKSLKRISD